MFIVGGYHDDRRQVFPMLQLSHHLQPAHGRHLEIEKHQVGMLAADLLECSHAVGGLAAAAIGDPAVFVSVDAMHQGPPGGGPCIAIIDAGE